ncbi:MAG: MBL fold metallo-hydrolase [Pirellulales bacterium]
MPRLTFHGAARTVTGSKYLLEAGKSKVLFDCGLFQGLKELRLKNWGPPPFSARQVDCVVVTHAHIDHIGYLPRLVNAGFRGPILATPATCELAEVMLLDSAETQANDAEYANRKNYSRHHPALPLYDARDVARTLPLFQPVEREEWRRASGPVWFRYHDAGHLLGSAMIEVEVREGEQPLRIVFSGDVGRYGAPLYHDPAPPPACDYLVCESTYGDRDHPPETVLEAVREAVERSMRRGGVLLVASFAVGRAQQLIYLLQTLIRHGKLPELPIYLDSPMAATATDIYRSYAGEHDLSEALLAEPANMLDGRNVHLARSTAESKRINAVQGPAVIIASSGMMTGGRILHHLEQRLPNPRNTVGLGGFMAAGTRGRALQEGAQQLKIHGRLVPVRAAVESLSALSGHAGRSELLRWLAPLEKPRRVFLTHGEPQAADSLAAELRTSRGWEVALPTLGESVEL